MGRKILVALLLASSSAAWAENFDNNTIISLTNAGIGDNVILAKIASLPCAYSVDSESLLKLRQSGVSSSVVTAMVERCANSSKAQGAGDQSSDPTVQRKPGLYLDLGDSLAHNLHILRPTIGMTGKISGNGSLLFPFTAKLGIPNSSAQTRTSNNNPVFYFYFETGDSRVSDFGTAASIAAQSPSEFSLVHFKVKDGQREMPIGKSNMFGTRLGVNPKDSIQTNIEEIGDGIFRVSLKSVLESGEYGFILKAGSDTYRIYDFSVG